MKKTLAELAELVNGRLAGDGALEITGATNIFEAREGQISFVVEQYIEPAKQCLAGAVLLPEGVGDFPRPAIYVKDPRAAFAVMLELFTPKLKLHTGVSEQAFIGEDVKLGNNVTIMPFAFVDDHAVIGDNVILYPHTYIGQFAEIGADSVIYSSVTVREYCKLGQRVIIHSSTVIGSDGFGFTTADGVHTKVPQVGNVVVEDDVEIGSHVGVDRAMTSSTVIGKGTKIDNLVQIGHNCRIGKGNLIVAQTGISGSTESGDYVTFGGQTGTVGHIKIGGNSVFAARSGITQNTPEGVCYAGFPARPHQEWLRNEVVLRKANDMMKRIKQLEKRLAAYENEQK